MRFVSEINSYSIAEKIANWEYPEPYDIYNMSGSK